MPRDEVEAAYFALLRAREEVDRLQRYGEYLADEQRRIRRFRSEGAALEDTVDTRTRRFVRHTDERLEEVLRERLGLIADELAELPDRIADAEAFVTECETEHARLRNGV